jgi:subfamily B ATP-binding cassette protein HlyB/CyaB
LIEVLVASFFVQLFGLANPLVIQVLIDKVIVQGGIDTLNVLGIFLLIIALFEGVLSALRTFIFADTTNRIDFALGSEIIDRLYRLPLRFFEKRPVGEVATRVNELENIRQFMTGTALTVVLDAVFSVIYIVIMFLYNWGLSLVALSVIPLFIILTLVASPLLRSQLRTRAERNAEAQSHLVETLSGIQTVKGQNIELQSKWKWQQRYSNYIDASYRTVITSSTAGAISHFLEQLSGLVILWVGANMVLTSKGEFTLGQLIAFRIIAGYVTSPLLRLVQLWQNFQETGLSLERLSDIVDTPTEVEMAKSSITLPPVKGLIQYEDVCFRFASTGPLQLAGVSITIPAGAFVGIVGQSGSGKSTLLKLLCRLYEPTTGRILVDNYDINKVDLYSVRSQLGMVPQEPLLFEGTIRENIALVNPEASDEEIIQAAKIAVAHEFIMNLPSGYDTRVGEKGSGLSGGQRQRIAIARTVLQNPRLLLLDEATSALDYDTERKVCSNLINRFRGKTVLFITHRLKVIQQADMILVMDHGVLEEQGTHQQLMEKRGRYFCLYQQQDSSIV